MSYNNDSKIYVNGKFFREVETKYGNMLKISMSTEEVSEFLKKYRDERGFVTVAVMKRREASAAGNTHYAVLDTYKHEQKEQASFEKPKGNIKTGYYGALSTDGAARSERTSSEKPITPIQNDENELPF